MQNIGLMAQKAEEYGSHSTTFELAEAGTVTVTAEDGTVLMSFECEAGDIWRMSRTKDIPIRDWVRLTVERTKLEQVPAIFWLDDARVHDLNGFSWTLWSAFYSYKYSWDYSLNI